MTNNNSTETFQFWNTSINKWEYNIKNEYKYDGQKNLIENKSWDNNNKILNNYSVTNQLLESIIQFWNNDQSTWMDYHKDSYMYDVNNNLIQHTSNEWDLVQVRHTSFHE